MKFNEVKDLPRKDFVNKILAYKDIEEYCLKKFENGGSLNDIINDINEKDVGEIFKFLYQKNIMGLEIKLKLNNNGFENFFAKNLQTITEQHDKLKSEELAFNKQLEENPNINNKTQLQKQFAEKLINLKKRYDKKKRYLESVLKERIKNIIGEADIQNKITRLAEDFYEVKIDTSIKNDDDMLFVESEYNKNEDLLFQIAEEHHQYDLKLEIDTIKKDLEELQNKESECDKIINDMKTNNIALENKNAELLEIITTMNDKIKIITDGLKSIEKEKSPEIQKVFSSEIDKMRKSLVNIDSKTLIIEKKINATILQKQTTNSLKEGKLSIYIKQKLWRQKINKFFTTALQRIGSLFSNLFTNNYNKAAQYPKDEVQSKGSEPQMNLNSLSNNNKQTRVLSPNKSTSSSIKPVSNDKNSKQAKDK